MASRKGRAGGASVTDESVEKFGISITEFGNVGVTVEMAATRTGSVECFRAYSMLDSTTAAPPSLVAQMSRRCSGSATIGEARTSSSVTSFLYRAFGLFSPCRAFFTFTLAKSDGVAPYSSIRRRAYRAKYVGFVAPSRRNRSQSGSVWRSPLFGARKPFGVVSAPTTRATSHSPARIWARAMFMAVAPEAQAA